MPMRVQTKDHLSELLISRWEHVSKKLEPVAEEFPEREYDSRPVSEVRTFGDVLRHVAFWNRYVADSVRGRQSDDRLNELPKSEYGTKPKILKALKASVAASIAALREQEPGLSPEIAELVETFIEHTSEHYGQLVVYTRLNGMEPRASRV